MVIDVVTYNGEKELFEIRYNILKNYVDEFRVIEFDKTFSGKKKKSHLQDFKGYKNIRYFFVPEKEYSKYQKLAELSPNTTGADHWKREFCQKEYIKDCLQGLEDEDIILINDCDEIWYPIEWLRVKQPLKLGLLVYTYYLNNKSSEKFYGTLVLEYRHLKDKCLNHLRTQPNYHKQIDNAGWHFTSLKKNIKKKLTDSYTKETYANEWVMNNLNQNIKNNKDFLGRDFTYKVNENEWPQYLKENREKYKHLLRKV